MKKNENGFPSVNASHAPCFNSPRGNGNLNMGTENNGNGDVLGTQIARPKEGCSGANNNETQGRTVGPGMENGCDEVPLAYLYAPKQKFCMLYSAEDALKHGTLFENLYKPMGVYGRE